LAGRYSTGWNNRHSPWLQWSSKSGNDSPDWPLAVR